MMPSALAGTRSVVVLGTDKLRGSDCIDAITTGLAAGYRRIDTAQAYGNEKEIGEAIRRSSIPRDQISVATKISSGFCQNPGSFQEAYESARASIRRLDVSYVDLILVHAPGSNVEARRVTWHALERLVREGLVKDIGVSNYGMEHIMEMEDYSSLPPRVNQLEVNFEHRLIPLLIVQNSRWADSIAASSLVPTKRS